jgi:plastocyanin
MLKVIVGASALFGVLGFVACNSGTTPPPGGPLVDCPATIAIAGFTYATPSCQLKVGSSVTIQASGVHPLIGDGSTPLVVKSGGEMTPFSFTAVAADVGKTFGYQCSIHGPGGMKGSIKVVAAP